MKAALAGQTEIPSDYHLWSCFSAIAACLQDRVWLYRLGKQIPNMFTFLIGDSASGKGAAIHFAEEMVKGIDIINAVEAKNSAAGLSDIMANKEGEVGTDTHGRTIDPEKMFIVTPELKDNIGTAGQAESFISMATNIWEGAKPIPQIEYTRNGKTVHMLVAPCLNWLAGTNKRWLMESLSVSALQGGFIGRVACVQPKGYSLDLRVYDYKYYDDHDKMVDTIQKRLLAITFLSGEFKLMEDADKVFRNWYEHRPSPPVESPVAPVWKRLPQMVCKVAMLLSVADNDSLVITSKHLNNALTLCSGLYADAQSLLAYANVTPKTETIYKMAAVMKENKQLPQARLIQMLSVTYDDFMQALQTLEQSAAIEIVRESGKKPMIKWLGSKGWI